MTSRNDASICISSKELTAAEITEIFDIDPTQSHEKGTPVNPRKPEGLIRDTSVWILDSDISEDKPMSEHLDDLLEFIEESPEQFEKIKSTCKIELICGFFADESSSFLMISAEMLKRLTVLPIDILIYLYPETKSD